VKRLEVKSMVVLRHHLKALRLPTITVEYEYEKDGAKFASDNVDHLSHLLRPCELKLPQLERKIAERSMKAAKFPIAKTSPRPTSWHDPVSTRC
jgi:hypothetical protein